MASKIKILRLGDDDYGVNRSIHRFTKTLFGNVFTSKWKYMYICMYNI